MKKNLTLIFFALSCAVYSQVGIGTTNPTKMLDVDGELRVRALPDKASPVYYITADEDGNLTRSPKIGGTCEGGIVANDLLDLSSFRADDQFDCIMVVRKTTGGITDAVINLPKGPTAGNLNKVYSILVYVDSRYIRVNPNADNGNIMFSPCGFSGAFGTCRGLAYFDIDGNGVTDFISSSFNTSANHAYTFKTLRFTWFNNLWHVETE